MIAKELKSVAGRVSERNTTGTSKDSNHVEATDIIQDERINELDHGLMSGSKKGDKIHTDFMKEFNKLPKDPIDLELAFPKFDKMVEKKFKAEPAEHSEKRVRSFYNSLSKDKKHIIVFTHGGITAFTMKVLFNLLPANNIGGDLTNGKNCTIMCITKEKNKYQLITLPNTRHLK